jgi:outer membrane protein
MMKQVISSLLLAVALLFSSVSFSGAIKVGVVDVHKLIEQSTEVKALNARLKKEFKPRQQKIMAAQHSLQQKAERLKREMSVMSESEKTDFQSKLVVEQRNLQRLQQDYQQDISLVQNREMKKFFTRLKAAVDKYARDNQYDIILQKDAAPFASAKVDVTTAVLHSLK